MAVYQHVLPSMQREAAAAFESLVATAEPDEDHDEGDEPADTVAQAHASQGSQAG